ncbi:MAG: CotO family spore coat protein [Bacillaceae bacterium]
MKEESKNSSVYSKPLLYIHQPGVKDVEVNMQQVYRVTKEKNKKEIVEDENEQIENEQRENEQRENEQFQKLMNSDEQLLIEEHTPKVVQKKTFKDMEISEKIDYLLNRPSYIPKPLCSVEVDGEPIVGYITKRKDDLLFIQGRESMGFVTVPINEILALRMIVW